MKKLILLVAILLISDAMASGIPLRNGDHVVKKIIEYDYDIYTNSYHGHGGNLCCECNTTVKNAVRSREGRIYCLTCWEAYLFDESIEM